MRRVKRSSLLYTRRVILIFEFLMLWKNPNNKPQLKSLLTQPRAKIDRSWKDYANKVVLAEIGKIHPFVEYDVPHVYL